MPDLGHSQPDTASQGLARRYRELSRRVYTTWDDAESQHRQQLSPDERRKTFAQMHQLITQEVVNTLSSRGSNGAGSGLLRDRIKAIQTLSHATLSADYTNTPLAVPFSLDSRVGYCASYLILKGAAAIPDSDVYLECFYASAGHMEVVTANTSDMHQRTLFVYQVPKQVAGEERVLLWGNRLGDTSGRLSARLYSFNGREFRTIWRRDDLTSGELRIANGAVELSYDPAYKSSETHFKHERLYFTPRGLE